MSDRRLVIEIHAAAPPKPAEGAPCNGCGVCCLIEPCPVGMLVSRKRRGACAALMWDAAESRYRCAMVSAPRRHLPAWWPRSQRVERGVARWALRFIAAGTGCDCAGELSGDPS